MNGTHDAFISLMICLLCSVLTISVLPVLFRCQPIVSNISTKNSPVSICIRLSEYWQHSTLKTRNIWDFTPYNPNQHRSGHLTATVISLEIHFYKQLWALHCFLSCKLCLLYQHLRWNTTSPKLPELCCFATNLDPDLSAEILVQFFPNKNNLTYLKKVGLI